MHTKIYILWIKKRKYIKKRNMINKYTKFQNENNAKISIFNIISKYYGWIPLLKTIILRI